MSRVSKIPTRHQGATPSQVHSTIAQPHQLTGITSANQADQHRTSYRAKCDTRRNGKVLETTDENGGWAPQQAFQFINRAKAATSNRRYTL
jgi:hypothetical protein